MKEKPSRVEQRNIDQQVGERLEGYRNTVRVFKLSLGEEPPTDFSRATTMLESIRSRRKRLAAAQCLEFIAAQVAIRFWNLPQAEHNLPK